MKFNFKKKNKMGEKGVVTISIIFIISFVILTLFFGVLIPAMQNFNIKIWSTNDTILESSDEASEKIKDSELKTAFNNSIQSQKDASTTNVEFLGFLNQYAWFFISVITLLTLFVIQRSIVETQAGIV